MNRRHREVIRGIWKSVRRTGVGNEVHLIGVEGNRLCFDENRYHSDYVILIIHLSSLPCDALRVRYKFPDVSSRASDTERIGL